MSLMALKSVLSSQFIQRSKTVLIGTVIGQAITFLSSLIITHYYAPQDLGMLGILTALISLVAGTLAFRLETLVMQVEDSEAVKTFVQSTLISMGATLLFCGLCFFLPWEFAQHITKHFGLFFVWSCGYFIFFNSKQLNFKFLQLSDNNAGTIGRSLFLFIFYWLAGLFHPTFNMLLGGRGISDYVGSLFHLRKYRHQIFKRDHFVFSVPSFIKKNKEYFLYITPHHLLIALSGNIFIFFLEMKFTLYDVGLFALAQRLIQAPIEMVGNTISQVALKRFHEHKMSLSDLRKFLLKIMAFSIGMGALCGLGMFLTVDFFFSFLKPEWQAAGTTVKCLIPYFVGIILIMPLNQYLRVVNRARLQLGIEIVEVALKVTFLSLLITRTSNELVFAFSWFSLGLALVKGLILFRTRPA